MRKMPSNSNTTTAPNVFSDLLARCLKPIVEIHPGERLKTFLMFSYFFLIIALIYILKPVRSSLFLDEMGAQNLRYVYMGEGIFLIFFTIAYVQFAKRVSKRWFYLGILGFFLSNLCLFWLFFRLKIACLSAYFYIWVAAFTITMPTQFWTLANDIFNPNEAKRLFGLIISGGSIGGVLGGLLTHHAAHWLKTEDLLLVAAFVLLLCMFLIGFLWTKIGNTPSSTGAVDAEGHGKVKSSAESLHHSIFKIFLGSSYLLMLTGIVIMAKMNATIIDNHFNGIVAQTVIGKEAKTAFFGGFFALLNVFSFLMQFLFTSLCLRYLGIGFSLRILPVGLALASLLSYIHPVLGTAIILKLYDGSANYSIQQASKEVLFLPIPSALRYRVKPVIDMLGFRGAKTLAGLYILAGASLFHLKDDRLSILVFAIAPVWLFLVWRMKKAYVKLLHGHLLNRRQYDAATTPYRATDILSFLHDEKSFETVQSFMNHYSPYARKLAATAYLSYVYSGKDLRWARRIVNQMVHSEALERVYGLDTDGLQEDRDLVLIRGFLSDEDSRKIGQAKTLQGALGRLEASSLIPKCAAVLTDLDRSPDEKRRAVRILGQFPLQEAVNELLAKLDLIQDHALRFLVVKVLNQLRQKNPALVFSRAWIRSEVARETVIQEKIQKLRFFYDHERSPSAKTSDYLGITLNAIQDESLERMFRFLDLLYAGEVMPVIYDRMIHRQDNEPLRVHAMELLNNVVEHDIFGLIERVLEGKQYAAADSHVLIDILKDFMVSEDRWFSLVALFIVFGLKLSQRWPGLSQVETEFVRQGMAEG